MDRLLYKQQEKMIRITKIWFEGNWMYGLSEDGKTYRQSILWYWRLIEATPEQLNDYTLSHDGIHWRNINEDIGMDSFEERNNIEPNAMQRFFLTHRELNLAGIAKYLNINPTLLRDYINGWKTPSEARVKEIREGIRRYALSLQNVTF